MRGDEPVLQDIKADVSGIIRDRQSSPHAWG